jgi:hypothetical protein
MNGFVEFLRVLEVFDHDVAALKGGFAEAEFEG